MEKCKFCQQELEEGVTLCPACGKDNAETSPVEEVTSVEEVPAEETPVENTPDGEAPVEEAPVEETPVEEEAPVVEEKPARKTSPGQMAALVAMVVVVIAVIIGLVVSMGKKEEPQQTEPTQETEAQVVATVPADGNPDDVTCKGTYTADDETVIAAGDEVVARIGDYTLTNSQLQVYYWTEVQTFLSNYGSSAYYYGLDYNQPLDTQICQFADANGKTWQQLFLENCLGSWQNYQVFSHLGGTMPEEYQQIIDTMEGVLAENAQNNGFADAEALVKANFGPGSSVKDYRTFMELYYQGYGYFNELYNGIDPTDEEVDAYYTANEATFADQGITRDSKFVDVRHILIQPQGGTYDETTNTTTYTDEEWAACEATAQAVLDEYLDGDMSEESFAQLANTYTADGNDTNMDGQPDGGLYTQVTLGMMVSEFEDWCFDEARVSGDYGLVRTMYGYHVMYFVQDYPMWDYYARSQLIEETSNAMVKEAVDQFPMEVDYSKIVLGFLDLGA